MIKMSKQEFISIYKNVEVTYRGLCADNLTFSATLDGTKCLYIECPYISQEVYDTAVKGPGSVTVGQLDESCYGSVVENLKVLECFIGL